MQKEEKRAARTVVGFQASLASPRAMNWAY